MASINLYADPDILELSHPGIKVGASVILEDKTTPLLTCLLHVSSENYYR
jgi:hypothetical protein